MPIAVEFIDGPNRGELFLLEVEGDSPADLLGGFDRDGVRYNFVDQTGEGGGGKIIDSAQQPATWGTDFAFYVTKDPVELFHWWKSLTPGARSALSAEPDGPVPREFLAEIVHSGQMVAGAYWPSTEAGPNGLYLPDRVQEWIHDHPVTVP